MTTQSENAPAITMCNDLFDVTKIVQRIKPEEVKPQLEVKIINVNNIVVLSNKGIVFSIFRRIPLSQKKPELFLGTSPKMTWLQSMQNSSRGFKPWHQPTRGA